MLGSTNVTGIDIGPVSKFLGIPFASAPRFNLPVPLQSYNGPIDATKYGPACIQQSMPIISTDFETAEESYGFLAGSEVHNEGIGNFGLYDQRVALKWIQTYIHAFGGDSTRVTILGQSAGAISASLQMLAFGGDTQGLFHGAFMQSGAPVPVDSMLNGQGVYDLISSKTGCDKTLDSLKCLREIPLEQLKSAVDASPNFVGPEGLHLAWPPRADGIFLQEAPMKQILAGKVSSIPIVSGMSGGPVHKEFTLISGLGNCDDEGTGFSISPLLAIHVLTEDSYRGWIRDVWLPNATEDELSKLWDYYPADPTQGSPFDTGLNNTIYTNYKRVSAFQGDIVFQAPRRFMLKHIASKQKVWSYLSKRLKLSGPLGSDHGSDLRVNLTDPYVISFVNTLNPNVDGTTAWPEYTNDTPNMLTFYDDPLPSPNVTQDTYRLLPMEYLSNLSLAYPI
ncbi:Lipase 4 [Psilocybe cubensis]|uniref:Lipase 4 n=1 Tax=Psilocybe cubensis TaxID=181762 RepID=A0ACB8H5X0_PSICU|nr:Lipase 4 [Psilocybe cubensis]KAH9483256.1 Lipase 4 [Psilocybe cubensis]